MIVNTDARTHVHLILEEGDSPALVDIVQLHIPEWARLFDKKNREYRGAEQELGAPAQFVDMNRKMKKLKTALWDREPEALTSEPTEEVLMDLIGHCFLTLHLLREHSSE